MQIPGHIDPVPMPRNITPRVDGRTDLMGLPREQIRVLLEEAGLDAKQAKLRSKQLFHWIFKNECHAPFGDTIFKNCHYNATVFL